MTPSDEFLQIQRQLLEHAQAQTEHLAGLRKLFSQWGWGACIGFAVGVLLSKM